MKTPESVLRLYLATLHQMILRARMDIRYGKELSQEQMHDLLDSMHNVPEMLLKYGGWFHEDNIDQDLKRYFERWLVPDDSEDTFEKFMEQVDQRMSLYDCP